MNAHEPVNILLVDDQPAKLLSYEVILGELGENLIKANSAREALELLLKNDVAVILMDVCMPELDGFELARMMREHPRYEKTAIIFISAVHLSDLDRCAATRPAPSTMCRCPWSRRSCAPRSRSSSSCSARPGSSSSSTASSSGACGSGPRSSRRRPRSCARRDERLRLASEAAGLRHLRLPGGRRPGVLVPYLRQLVGIERGRAADPGEGAGVGASRPS